MKTIELVPGHYSSQIGFGCAPILGSVDRARSLRGLEVAYEAGITHFDVAPSYGYGEAEGFLGDFLTGGKRQRVVIATKHGIEANAKAKLLKPLKGIARATLKLLKGSRPASAGSGGQAIARAMLNHVPITADSLEKSVHRSLKRLRTDYLDIVLLHEPPQALGEIDAIFESAHRLKDAGKILGFGFALTREQWPIHAGILPKCDLLQFDAASPETPLPDESVGKPTILFSPFRTAKEGESREDVLRRLVKANDQSVVLCSMFSEAHIRSNVNAVS